MKNPKVKLSLEQYNELLQYAECGKNEHGRHAKYDDLISAILKGNKILRYIDDAKKLEEFRIVNLLKKRFRKLQHYLGQSVMYVMFDGLYEGIVTNIEIMSYLEICLSVTTCGKTFNLLEKDILSIQYVTFSELAKYTEDNELKPGWPLDFITEINSLNFKISEVIGTAITRQTLILNLYQRIKLIIYQYMNSERVLCQQTPKGFIISDKLGIHKDIPIYVDVRYSDGSV